MTQKFIDRDGLKVLWNQVNLKDYPNNETLMAVIDAIDETKADKTDIDILSEDIKNKQFYITVSGNDTDGYTMDKTFEKLVQAYNDGKILYCGVEYDGMSILCPLKANNSTETFVFTTTADSLNFACVITNEGIMVDVSEMALKSDIPVVDTELNASSNNAISNKAVSEKFTEIDKPINWLGDDENADPLEEKIINKPFYSSFTTDHNNNIYTQRLTFENGECSPTQVPELIVGNTYRVHISALTIFELCTATAFTIQGVQAGIQLNFGYGCMVVVYDEYIDEIGASCLIVLKDNSVNGEIQVTIYDTIETIHKLDKKYLPKELDAAMNAFETESKPVEILKIDPNYNYEKTVAPDGSMYFLHVSNSTFTIDELTNGVTVTYEEQGQVIEIHFEQSELFDTSGCIMGVDTETDVPFIITLEDNYSLEGIIFEKTGIYLIAIPTEDNAVIYPSSVQVHGHTINGLNTIVKDDYLPSDVVVAGEIAESCFENVGIEADIAWDGDTTDKDVFMGQYYHVSDIIPSKSDLLKGGKIICTSIEGDASVETEITSDRIAEIPIGENEEISIIAISAKRITSSTFTAILILPDDISTDAKYKKGVYLFKNSSEYVSLLDLNDFKLPFYKLKPEHVDMSDIDIDLSEYETKIDASTKLEEAKAYTDSAVKSHNAYSSFYFSNYASTYADAPTDSDNGPLQVLASCNNESLAFIAGNNLIEFAPVDNDLSDSVTITINADPVGSADEALEDAKAYVDNQIAALINSAPETLDTLGELATAFNENKEVVDVLNEAIITKANQSDLSSHTTDTTVHITNNERESWNKKAGRIETEGNTVNVTVDGVSSNYTIGTEAESFNGTTSTAIGNRSHAEGYNTKAIGTNSHAEGSNSISYGGCSHAEGTFSLAYGDHSHAEGYQTKAIGALSHTEGYYTSTLQSGHGSHAEGEGTVASDWYQHVQGKYNKYNQEGSYAHIVGNGTADDARSNAHTLDWDGNAWFSGDVYVGSTSGVNKDKGSKKLATEDYMTTKLNDYYLKTEADALHSEIKDYVDTSLNAFTSDDAVTLLAETGFIEPVGNNGYVFTNEDNVVYTF